MRPRVLVVEDEQPLAVLLRYNLEADGYDVDCASRGDEAELRLREQVPDLVLLDWILPGLSGIELCRRLRARAETRALPIIMLTAREEEGDRVRGLTTGADDYLTKPFSIPELLARVRAVLRRARPAQVAELLVGGDVELDRAARRVRRAGHAVHLGPTEFRLLEFLMQSPGRVFSREQLLDAVWGRDVYIDERTVDVHVGRLRRAIASPDGPDPIRTVRGAGYAFDETFGEPVRGLNTAATLWCSATVGAFAGADLLGEAVLLTLAALAGNTLLRPLVNAIDRAPLDERQTEAIHEVRITTTAEALDAVRERVVERLEAAHYPVREVAAVERASEEEPTLVATLVSTAVEPGELDAVARGMAAEPGVAHATWTTRTGD